MKQRWHGVGGIYALALAQPRSAAKVTERQNMQILQHPIARACACAAMFCICFALIATPLSHQLFIWADAAYPAERSKFVLWVIYAVAGVGAAGVMYACKPSPLESLLVGGLCAVAAGGAYCIGYSQVAIVMLIVIVAFLVVLYFLRASISPATVVRALYICLGIALAVPLATFLASANSLQEVKALTHSQTSNTATQITNDQWAYMSNTQRESFLAGVVAAEAQRLGLSDVEVTTCILPESVAATVDSRGRVLLNFAAIRVESPDPYSVLDFQNKNGVAWTYEDLTSPRDITLATCHAVAHIYEQKRVAGELEAQRSWPYEDASDADANNSVIDEWSEGLPIDARTDDGSAGAAGTTLLESQAWGYAYTRIGAYVKE